MDNDRHKTIPLVSIALLAFVTVAAACSQRQNQSADRDASSTAAIEHPAGTAEHPAGTGELAVELDEALAAKLALADAADGSEDRVVAKCIGCGLGMDGKADHAVSRHGYEFHLCSDHCQKIFEEDAAEMIAALQIP